MVNRLTTPKRHLHQRLLFYQGSEREVYKKGGKHLLAGALTHTAPFILCSRITRVMAWPVTLVPLPFSAVAVQAPSPL